MKFLCTLSSRTCRGRRISALGGSLGASFFVLGCTRRSGGGGRGTFGIGGGGARPEENENPGTGVGTPGVRAGIGGGGSTGSAGITGGADDNGRREGSDVAVVMADGCPAVGEPVTAACPSRDEFSAVIDTPGGGN